VTRAALLLWPLVLLAADATAAPSLDLADIHHLRSAVLTSHRADRYTRVHALWRAYSYTQPRWVAEALDSLATDRGLGPEERAYAATFAAYARASLGDFDGAREKLLNNGYISNYWITGPFDNDGKSGLDTAFGPEAAKIDRTSRFEGKERRAASWRKVTLQGPFGWLDGSAYLRPSHDACFYAATAIRNGAKRPSAITLFFGTSGAVRAWWNGEVIARDDKYRDIDPDRHGAKVALQAGDNRLVVKVCGGAQPPLLSVRVGDAHGGPAKAPPLGDPFGDIAPPAPSEAMPADIGTLTRAAKEAELKGDGQERFARYLQATHGDDPSENMARKWLSAALDAKPTVARYVLAASLAEGSNQRALYLEKAAALAEREPCTREERVELGLARADLVRASLHEIDALGLYDKVLAISPRDVEATISRAELLAQAGLHETARVALASALARAPQSALLLRATVNQLRQMDRTTELLEYAARYDTVRAIDPSRPWSKVELAIARRDVKAAVANLERIVRIAPESSASLRRVGDSYLQLGDYTSAQTSYLRALALAPDDEGTLKASADAFGLAGNLEEQKKRLQRIATLMPQKREIQQELAHLSQETPARSDEHEAISPDAFLALRRLAHGPESKRTLVRLQQTTVYPTGLASRFHQVVFQPLTDDGAKHSRDFTFSYEAEFQSASLRRARIYHADGTSEDASDRGEVASNDPSMSMYTSERTAYVRFGRLAVGDVVEVSYRVDDTTPYNAYADYFGEVTYLQATEPTLIAKYVLDTPKSRILHFNALAGSGITQNTTETKDRRVYTFEARNLKGLEPEPGMPPLTEQLAHVHASTYASWEEMGRWYWTFIRDQLVADDALRRLAKSLTLGLTKEREKVNALYRYVVQSTRYVALEFGVHGYKPYRCAQIVARGFGDCKDKASLLYALLHEVGIEARMVIVRTGHKGLFERAPASLAPFDHAIAYVPSLDLYLDGTAEYTGSSELPLMDAGAIALQVGPNHTSLVTIPEAPAAKNVTERWADVRLTASGSAAARLRVVIRGAEAAAARTRFHAEATRKQRIQDWIGRLLPSAKVLKSTVSPLDDIELAPSFEINADVPQFARKEGNLLAIGVGPRTSLVRTLAPTAARLLPLRLSARQTQRDTWRIELPRGAKLREGGGTNPQVISTAGAKLEIATELSGNVATVTSVVTIDQTRFSASEYPQLRRWAEDADRVLERPLLVEVSP
jgi:tetratricopeptide (TPR) repeat protein/transglutaminase-like putative cysteine protease